MSTGNGHWMAAATITHGWHPEAGFLPDRWDTGYSEALILYVLAAVPRVSDPRPPATGNGHHRLKWKLHLGMEYVYAGPLFIHQLSHIWLDFRGMQDDLNRILGFDYFENSRRATYVHRQYGIENPGCFKQYGEYVWGLTASEGPGPQPSRWMASSVNFSGTGRAERPMARMMARYRPGLWWRPYHLRPRLSSTPSGMPSNVWSYRAKANTVWTPASTRPFLERKEPLRLDFAVDFRAESGSDCPDD